MITHYPIYKYTSEDVANQIARFVPLDNSNSYPFDNYHAHEYNEILMFTNGGGTHNINFKNHKIQNNSIHLLAANDLHWVERSMNSKGFAIVYKDQFLQKLQMMNPTIEFHTVFADSRIINLTDDDAKDFALIIEEMMQHKTQSAYMLQVIGVFIAKITSLNYKRDTSKKIYDNVVSDVIALIDKNYKTKMKIADYARALNLTPRTLQNRFKKATSVTINHLQQERVMKEAKRLLCTTDLNINAIATELGFNETSHFTNWFKKKAKCLPLDYKYEND